MGFCCFKITTYYFLFFNHICFIMGTLILSCGIRILSNKGPIGTLVTTAEPLFEYEIYLFTVIGAITMLMGFLGCIWAFHRIESLLSLYLYFLALILMVQVSNVVITLSEINIVKSSSKEITFSLIYDYNPADMINKTIEITWDTIQSQFNCCGFEGPGDWENNLILEKANYTLYPCSCHRGAAAPQGFCPLEVVHRVASSIKKWPVVQDRCGQAVYDWIDEQSNLILGFSFAVVSVEFFGMMLFFHLKKHNQEPESV